MRSACLRALYCYNLNGISAFRRGVDYVTGYMSSGLFDDDVVSHVYSPVANMGKMGLLREDHKNAYFRYYDARIAGTVERGEVVDMAYLTGAMLAAGGTVDMAILNWLAGSQNADGGFGKYKPAKSAPGYTAIVALALKNLF